MRRRRWEGTGCLPPGSPSSAHRLVSSSCPSHPRSLFESRADDSRLSSADSSSCSSSEPLPCSCALDRERSRPWRCVGSHEDMERCCEDVRGKLQQQPPQEQPQEQWQGCAREENQQGKTLLLGFVNKGKALHFHKTPCKAKRIAGRAVLWAQPQVHHRCHLCANSRRCSRRCPRRCSRRCST